MDINEYRTLSDDEKIDFLRLMYSYVKEPLTETQAKCKELIIQETQLCYSRITQRK